MTSKWRLCLIIIIILASLIGAATPVLAGTEGTGVQGTPQLEATLIGSNEFPAGQPGTVQIILLNKGTFTGDVKNPADKVMARGYTSTVGATVVPPCTTAVAVTATLISANDAIQILSGPAGIGALPAGSSTPQPMSFQIRVAQNAPPATYQLKLNWRTSIWRVLPGSILPSRIPPTMTRSLSFTGARRNRPRNYHKSIRDLFLGNGCKNGFHQSWGHRRHYRYHRK